MSDRSYIFSSGRHAYKRCPHRQVDGRADGRTDRQTDGVARKTRGVGGQGRTEEEKVSSPAWSSTVTNKKEREPTLKL